MTVDIAGSDTRQLRQLVRSRNDVIFEIVRDRICLREYDEGHVIHETALATEFRVSRTPIRQVLQRLVYEQLAETRNGVGTIVSYVGPQSADMLRFRIGLTRLIADLIPLQLPSTLGSDYARLQALAGLLKPESSLKEAWDVWRTHHEVRNALIGDEALRQMDDTIFFRTARSWIDWLKREPMAMHALLVEEIAAVVGQATALSAPELFRLHATHLERMLARYGAQDSK
ncbi:MULTISPECIES: GntR family transcriptional regulator [Bosea]|uniref:GntR family transcriptional regulator n=1 Tax=Bosea TaxID=85413 RepID=UPI00214F6E73|nr:MULTISPECIES: GntR family transcriptional regulator [Bosea]MCR4521565.1 GntR family transcriptional regulator [Bosea sp. 47.2.35]MDR6829310.1 DNA-binding GntR family transcriptional regulator [Bosea robiniae]MDR6896175.1 DNA-binding GntR family transcriptional regulator [Bosea sp. BE109]MDR7139591.1 DNA-binding GntR family transcriptional regulator [Bosea sp. BE168]MDR7176270.1 DNA-binding GntR family transcriptional regulator [Bosea sp. BE271]